MQPNQIFYPREVISVADVKVDLDSLGYLSGSYRGLSDTVSSAQTYQSTHINLNASGKVSGVSTAVLSAMLAMQGECVSSVEGIIDDCVDCSIRNLAKIGKEAMNETDRCVLDIMTSKS